MGRILTVLANRAWALTARRARQRFLSNVCDVQSAQTSRLSAILDECRDTMRGRDLHLKQINSYDEFRALPLSLYEDYQPYIDSIMAGEDEVLTKSPVRLLEPTSGTNSATKYIPYTAALQAEYQEALHTWVSFLYDEYPQLRNGHQYWSISPNTRTDQPCSEIPIGFADDGAYFGKIGQYLLDAILAVPARVARMDQMDEFEYTVLLHLLNSQELRLISIWHPSYLVLLFEKISVYWERILVYLSASDKSRAGQLKELGPHAQWQSYWPQMTLISSWGGPSAQPHLDMIQHQFPNSTIQEKGLISTEGITTFPCPGHGHVLAMNSHFYEFMSERTGEVHPSWQLEIGETYQLILSTSSGFLRYQTNDRVTVTGFFKTTPTLKFCGRAGITSDLVGEKLALPHVEKVLNSLLPTVAFKILAPLDQTPPAYGLYMSAADLPDDPDFTRHLDDLLKENYHYAHARNLAQLAPPSLCPIPGNAMERYRQLRAAQTGAKLGDIKIQSLSKVPLTELSTISQGSSGHFHSA